MHRVAKTSTSTASRKPLFRMAAFCRRAGFSRAVTAAKTRSTFPFLATPYLCTPHPRAGILLSSKVTDHGSLATNLRFLAEALDVFLSLRKPKKQRSKQMRKRPLPIQRLRVRSQEPLAQL